MKKTAKGTTEKAGIMPYGDRVLVRPLSPEEAGEKRVSGIIIPETIDKEKPEQRKVIAVGQGARDEDGKRMPVEVKVGDTVVFSKYGYDEIKIGGTEYYMISEKNILGIIT